MPLQTKSWLTPKIAHFWAHTSQMILWIKQRLTIYTRQARRKPRPRTFQIWLILKEWVSTNKRKGQTNIRPKLSFMLKLRQILAEIYISHVKRATNLSVQVKNFLNQAQIWTQMDPKSHRRIKLRKRQQACATLRCESSLNLAKPYEFKSMTWMRISRVIKGETRWNLLANRKRKVTRGNWHLDRRTIKMRPRINSWPNTPSSANKKEALAEM